MVRGDTTKKRLAIVFTGDEFADGGEMIAQALQQQKAKASFFFTGRFYANPAFTGIIRRLKKDGHYLGAHSDQHILYCDWNKRDSLLVNKNEFTDDLLANYKKMEGFGIRRADAPYFLPPYEWYNDSIAAWTRLIGLQLINFSSGTRSNADYTTPDMKNYRSSKEIYRNIIQYEKEKASGLNGFILLMHIGTDPKRTDKLYALLPQMLQYLKKNGYSMVTVQQLLE